MISQHQIMMSFGGGSAPPPFDTSTFYQAALYTGDGTTSRLIAAGIDLSGGGISWVKRRDGSAEHAISFSDTGSTVYTAGISAATTPATGSATFGATGSTLISTTNQNVNTNTYVNWQFRKMAGYLDVVPYTGNGTNRTIAHSLGVEPAAIIIIRLGGTGSRRIYHRDYGGAGYANLGAATRFQNDSAFWNNTAATSSVFSLGTSSNVNGTSVNYVALVFAHNPSMGIAGFIYTGNGSSSGPTVSLGWNPRYILYFGTGPAGAAGSSSRSILDTVRTPGFVGNDAVLVDSSSAETSATEVLGLTGTGFQILTNVANINTSGIDYYGLAIG